MAWSDLWHELAEAEADELAAKDGARAVALAHLLAALLRAVQAERLPPGWTPMASIRTVCTTLASSSR